MKVVAGALACLALAACSQKQKEAQEAVSRQLFDPSSAQFRNVFVGKSSFVCGEVNGKNRFGGFVGFRQFFYDSKTRASEIDPQEIISPQAKEIFGNTADYVMDSSKFAEQFSANCGR